jgi:hypothetical protein
LQTEVAAISVDTILAELTGVLVTFINVVTAVGVRAEGESGATGAQEAAVCVLAVVLTAAIVDRTLVYVLTLGAVGGPVVTCPELTEALVLGPARLLAVQVLSWLKLAGLFQQLVNDCFQFLKGGRPEPVLVFFSWRTGHVSQLILINVICDSHRKHCDSSSISLLCIWDCIPTVYSGHSISYDDTYIVRIRTISILWLELVIYHSSQSILGVGITTRVCCIYHTILHCITIGECIEEELVFTEV